MCATISSCVNDAYGASAPTCTDREYGRRLAHAEAAWLLQPDRQQHHGGLECTSARCSGLQAYRPKQPKCACYFPQCQEPSMLCSLTTISYMRLSLLLDLHLLKTKSDGWGSIELDLVDRTKGAVTLWFASVQMPCSVAMACTHGLHGKLTKDNPSIRHNRHEDVTRRVRHGCRLVGL